MRNIFGCSQICPSGTAANSLEQRKCFLLTGCCFLTHERKDCLFPSFFTFALHCKVSFQSELTEKSRLMLLDQIRTMKFTPCRAMDDIFGTFYNVNMTPRWNVNLEHHVIKRLLLISEQRPLFGSTTQRNSQKKPPDLFTFLCNSLKFIQWTKNRIWCNVAPFFKKKILKNSAQIRIQEIGIYMYIWINALCCDFFVF